METKPIKLGSSLPVPCVQELAKEPLTKVPPRYVRPDEDSPLISNSASLPKVPVIDMLKLLSGDSMDLELEKFHYACKEWGFFQLINHGVSISLLEKVRQEIQKLFSLSMEEKKKYWQEPGDLEGFGNAFVVSEEQKLDWGDMFLMTTLPTHSRSPHLFPKLPLSFRDTMEAYSADLKKLGMKILHLMTKALGMEPDEMTELFEEGWQFMRMNYYPPCPQPELVIGLSPHSDPVGLTILLQVNEMEGLQIRKDEMWVPIKSLQNAFVVNIGDILEIMSNGIYRSIEHRATVNSTKERLSIATLLNPKLDGDMGPSPSLITPQTPQVFKRIGVENYFKQIYKYKLDGKSFIDMMKIENEEGNSS